METLFISKETVLKRRENTLCISINGNTKFFPIEKIRHIVLLSESTMNSKLLCLCGANGVRISIFDYYGYFKGSFEPVGQNPSGRIKLKQAEHILHEQKRMMIAKEIVHGAAQNMLGNILYYQYRGNADLTKTTKDMKQTMLKINKVSDTSELMGIEGNIHAIYYAGWKYIDPSLDFTPRIRRPPNNQINCLISFLNQMVYTVVRHEIFKTHLDESLSWLHAPSSGRSSLSLDLAEPFKPVLGDSLIFKMSRQGIWKDNWFEKHEGVCLLTETGRRHVAEHFAIRLEEKLHNRTYREWIYKEALNIERHIMDVAEYESFKRKV